jgi:hypothetical protein
MVGSCIISSACGRCASVGSGRAVDHGLGVEEGTQLAQGREGDAGGRCYAERFTDAGVEHPLGYDQLEAVGKGDDQAVRGHPAEAADDPHLVAEERVVAVADPSG